MHQRQLPRGPCILYPDPGAYSIHTVTSSIIDSSLVLHFSKTKNSMTFQSLSTCGSVLPLKVVLDFQLRSLFPDSEKHILGSMLENDSQHVCLRHLAISSFTKTCWHWQGYKSLCMVVYIDRYVVGVFTYYIVVFCLFTC